MRHIISYGSHASLRRNCAVVAPCVTAGGETGGGRAAHAVSTYRQFIIENEEKLKQLPAPRIAQQYYLSDDPYLYNMDSALCRGPVEAEPRHPPCDNLHDVFVNILEDEWVRPRPVPCGVLYPQAIGDYCVLCCALLPGEEACSSAALGVRVCGHGGAGWRG